MNNIRVLAIDDEPLALQQLAAYIKKVPFLELVAQCESALQARDILNEEVIDAIFCDINMPDLNGMDFVKSLTVPPLIFVSFVENAFKHGVSYREESFIDISNKRYQDKHGRERLLWTCRNSKHQKADATAISKQGGVGMVNVRQRLDLIYGDDYTLGINETDNSYEVILDIPL